MSRAISLHGVPKDPNADLPDEGTVERQRLADEFARGRAAALAELRAAGTLFQPNGAMSYASSGFAMTATGVCFPVSSVVAFPLFTVPSTRWER